MKLGDAWPVVGRENGRAATSETAKAKLRVDTPCADAHITGVRLSFHPWTDSGFPSLGDHGLIANYGLLDAFAREYASDPHPTNTGERRGGKPQLQDFFLIWLPNRLFNIVAGLGKPPEPYQLDVSTPEGMGTAQWLAHLNGYYAAVWLRACWTAFDGERKGILSMRDRTFRAIYARQLDKARAVALYGSDDDALEFSRGMLRTNAPRPARPHAIWRLLRGEKLISGLNDRLPGDVGIFGYNAGFMQYILPPSLNAPTDARPFAEPYYTGDPNVLFDVHFALTEPAFMTEARKTYAVVNSACGEVAARLRELLEGRPGEAPLLASRQNWDTVAAVIYRVGHPNASSYRNFDQPQYDRLLAWTSYSVMMNVANGYNALSAYCTRDAPLARRHITASTLWWGFILTYILGVLDSRTDSMALADSLPRFLTSDGGTCQ